MSDDPIFSLEKAASEDEVAFDYIKAPDFRTVWADGLVGSLTPKGLVHFAVYAERPAIPRRQVFEVDKIDEQSGTLGQEVLAKQVSRGSIIREMSVDVMLTPEAAESFASWLLARVQEYKDRVQGGQ